MSSGKTVDHLTYKKSYYKGGIGKIRCPKCHTYAVKANVDGEMVYKCQRCSKAFRMRPV